MHTVKPVSLEMELDFHERLLNTVGKSIAATKKRLHDAELVLNLRPPDHEPAEIQEWNTKVAALIDRRGPLEFPTLYKVRKEYEAKALIKSIRSGRQRIESDEKFNQRMNRKLAKEAEMIKKKVLSNSATFGKKITGEAIRTIEDYKGGNTMYGGSRTLIVKEGSYVPPDPSMTSTPAWVGPGHYPNAAKVPKYDLHESQTQVPFKAQPRDATSVDVKNRAAVERRRRVVNEFKQRISANESLGSASVSRTHTASLESYYTGFGEGSSVLPRSHSPSRTALELAKADLLGDGPDLEIQIGGTDEDGGVSVASSLTHGSSLARSRGSRGGTGSKKAAVLFQDEEVPPMVTAEEEATQASTPRTATSSLFGQTRGRSILKSQRHTSAPTPKKRAPVLNPVYSRKDLTNKLIKADERFNSQFFKVKDYTMNAFALHSPEVAYVDEFEPADAEAPPDPNAGVYQNRPTGPFRKNKPIGIFTSDIFVVKPPEYVPPKPVERKDRSPTLLRPSEGSLRSPPANAVRSSPGGGVRSTMVATSAGPTRLSPLAARSASLASIKIDGSPKLGSAAKASPTNAQKTGVAAISIPADSTEHAHSTPLYAPSPKHTTPKAYQHATLTKDIQAERIKSERTINKVIQRRHNSQYFDTQRSLVDESYFSQESSPTASVSAPILPNLTTGKAVRKWLDSNDIIRANSRKSRVEGASFLLEHKPLPGIEMSLTGLLLDDNPYTPDDEFMREMFHRPASEIGK